MAATASPEWITEMQLGMRRSLYSPRTRADLRRNARWWELEALRGYTSGVDEYGMNSSDRSLMYAANQRWLVELLDAGRQVIGRRFDDIVRENSGMTWNAFVRRHAERICGDRYIKERKRAR
jgi:hypothetical protein